MLAEETTINISATAAPFSSEEMMDTSEPQNDAKQTVKLRKFLETEFESTIRCLDEEAKDEQIVKSFETQLQASKKIIHKNKITIKNESKCVIFSSVVSSVKTFTIFNQASKAN